MFGFNRAAKPRRTGVQTNGNGRQFVSFDEVAESELARVRKSNSITSSKRDGHNKTGGSNGTANTNTNGKAAAASGNGRLVARRNGSSEARVVEANGKSFRQNPR